MVRINDLRQAIENGRQEYDSPRFESQPNDTLTKRLQIKRFLLSAGLASSVLGRLFERLGQGCNGSYHRVIFVSIKKSPAVVDFLWKVIRME